MSVIFKTLKKLKAQSSEKITDAERQKLKKKTSYVRKIFTSSRTIIFLIVFILLSGLISVHLVNVIKGKREPLRQKQPYVASNLEGKNNEALDETKGIEETDSSIPPAPQNIPAEKPEVGKLYLPPKAETPAAKTDASPTMAVSSPSVKFLKSALSEETPKVTLPERAAAAGQKTETLERGKPARYLPPERAQTHKNPLPPALPPSPAIPEDQTVGSKAESPDMHLQILQVQKNRDIKNIIGEIKDNFKIRNDPKTEMLIDQLASLKGKNDPYVLKLKSFYLINQGNYEAAESLLSAILKKDKDDLEAGINMAILEIKTGQVREAKIRLYRLRDIHPQDTLIPDLINKIE
ncbi:MAG: tetratricopeptide repeat protein [Deltaproteobacteria bacterium]|nr:tetratricopeptide repeat protein [Deltaproteobacteria bacterium]